jgi:hypothetical protein
MADSHSAPETSLIGAAQQSSEESRQVLPLDHPRRGWLRLLAALVAGLVAVAALAVNGFEAAALTQLGYAVLVIAATIPGGNLTAVGHTLLGGSWLLLALVQLGVLTSSLNVLDVSVLEVCVGGFGVGLVVLGCGLYEWETDETGAMVRIGRRPVGLPVDAHPPGR